MPDPSDLEPEVAAASGDARGEIPAGEMADDEAGAIEAGAEAQDPIAA